MAVQYAPLFSLETQFQAKDGSNNTAGWLKVYLAATDDPAETYSDYLGTRNPEKIVLDDNGRAVVICDKAKAYRLEVYDADGMLLWTEEPVYCSGTGGGGISVTEVVSTDGSIAVESSVAGSMRTYDISIAPDNAKELLEWAKCSNTVDEDGYVYPLYGEGTMQTQVGKGLEVFKDRYYHLTNKITVIPSANGINYETITVQVMHDDNQGTVISLASHDFDIDNSVSDKVELEFSEDIIPEDDGFIFWRVTGRAPFTYVGLDMQIHRIYSGINAVPGFVASKPWVEQNISSKIDYSALEYNQQNLITGISGSAIASNAVDPNEYIPWSASGAFQPSGDYVYESAFSSYSSVIDNSISAISSVVSGVSSTYLEKTASGLFQPSGDYLSASESSNYYPMTGNPSGFITDEECQSSYLALSSFSSYSSTVDNSITGISSVVSGVSSTYLEKTASGMFQPSGDYVSSTDMSAYVPFSGLEHDGSGRITAISGSGVKGHEYTGVNPVWVDNTVDQIGVYRKTLAVDETMTAYESGDSAVIGVNTAILSGYAKASSLEDYQLKSAMTAYASVEYVDSGMSGKLDVTASSLFLTSLPADLATTGDVASAVSGKMDKSASGEFYPMTGNPSGFLTAHQSLAGYATEQYVDSSVSGKLDTTAYDSAQFILTSQSGMFQPSGYYQPSGEYLSATESSNYYSTSNPSGFADSATVSSIASSYAESAVSSKLDATAQVVKATGSGTWDYEDCISSVNGSPLYAKYAGLAYYDSALRNISQLPDTDSVSAIASAYAESAASSKQDASAMTAYQEVSGMTAYQPAGDYQPSGDYIYVSALGWAEV